MPDAIIGSFANDAGREIVVRLARGAERLHIAAVLQAIASIRPLMPLEIDRATLDAAMARWKADNKEMPTEPTAAILPDGIMICWLTDDKNNGEGAGTAVRNLAALAGLPITELEVRLWVVADLQPLKAMPLRRISLGTRRDNRAAFDLAPLAGAPLIELCSLSGNTIPVKSLAPLQGMPLRHLAVKGVADLSPLAGMPLADIELQEFAASGPLALRELPLERLTLGYSSSILPPFGKGTFAFVRLESLSQLTKLVSEYAASARCRAVCWGDKDVSSHPFRWKKSQHRIPGVISPPSKAIFHRCSGSSNCTPAWSKASGSNLGPFILASQFSICRCSLCRRFAMISRSRS